MIMQIVVAILAVVLIINMLMTLAIIQKLSRNNSRGGAEPHEGLPIGTRMPDFSAMDVSGTSITSADYIGKRTTFLFISPDCAPCMKDMNVFKEASAKATAFGDHFVFVSIADAEKSKSMIMDEDIGNNSLVAPLASNPMLMDFGFRGTPYFVTFDSSGAAIDSGVAAHTTNKWAKMLSMWKS